MIDTLKSIIQQIGQLQTEQRYAEAERLCYQTIETLPNSAQGNVIKISLQNRLFFLLEAQSRYEEALTLIQSTQETLDAIKPALSPDIAVFFSITTLSNLGMIQRIQGQYAEAETTFQRAIEQIKNQDSTTFKAKQIQLSNNLAIVYKYWGKFAQAEQLYREILNTLQKQYGNSHPDIAATYHNLAGLNHARGDYDSAEKWAKQSYQLHLDLFGDHHPKTIADGAAYGSILHGLQRWEEAIAHFQTAINFFEQQLGKNHYDLALNLNNLAASLQAQGILLEAENAYRKALEIKMNILGENHPELAITLHNLGSILQQTGKIAEAKSLFEQAKDIFALTLGEDHPHTQIVRDKLKSLLPSMIIDIS